MSELGIFSTFNNSELGCSITTLKVNGEIWFGATEFASSLEYAKPKKAIRKHVDESDKFYFQDLDTGDLFLGSNPRGSTQNGTPLQIQPYKLFISEAGAYCLIMRSNLPAAKKFQKWITKEVLTTLRKTGTYTIPEGALPKLKDINSRDVYNLCGDERREFKGKINEMRELLKSRVAVERGKRGGLKTQERIRQVKGETEKLIFQTRKLQNENKELEDERVALENQVDELTQELEAIKSGISEILADDY